MIPEIACQEKQSFKVLALLKELAVEASTVADEARQIAVEFTGSMPGAGQLSEASRTEGKPGIWAEMGAIISVISDDLKATRNYIQRAL